MKHIGRCVYEVQNLLTQHTGEKCNHHGQHDSYADCIAHIASHLVVIARTKGLCYRNGKASTRSVAEAHDKEHDTARSSHSSQCTYTYPASHNHRIDNQIQLLEDIAQNKGCSKCQNGAERCTGSHAQFVFHHLLFGFYLGFVH